jgi:hypothetical protein
VGILVVLGAFAAAGSGSSAGFPPPPYRQLLTKRTTDNGFVVEVGLHRSLSTYDAVWLEWSVRNAQKSDVHLLAHEAPVVVLSKGEKDVASISLTEGRGLQRSLLNRRAKPGDALRSLRADLRAYHGRFGPGIYNTRVTWSVTLALTGGEQTPKRVQLTSASVAFIVRATAASATRPGRPSPTASLTLLGGRKNLLRPWQEGAVLTNKSKRTRYVPYFRKREDAQGRVTLVTSLLALVWSPGAGWLYTRPLEKPAGEPRFHALSPGSSVTLRPVVPYIDGEGLYKYLATYHYGPLSPAGVPRPGLMMGAYSAPFFVVDPAAGAKQSRVDHSRVGANGVEGPQDDRIEKTPGATKSPPPSHQ